MQQLLVHHEGRRTAGEEKEGKKALCQCSSWNRGRDDEALVETANLHLRYTEKKQCLQQHQQHIKKPFIFRDCSVGKTIMTAPMMT